MSETYFSPGPWSVVDDPTEWPRVLVAIDGTGLRREVHVDGRHINEGTANAHLIAAAPDLYAALEDAFFALGRAGANALGGIYRDEWEAARDALARARGEEPAP